MVSLTCVTLRVTCGQSHLCHAVRQVDVGDVEADAGEQVGDGEEQEENVLEKLKVEHLPERSLHLLGAVEPAEQEALVLWRHLAGQ